MRTLRWIFLLAAIGLLCAGLSLYFLLPDASNCAVIESDGSVKAVLPLSVDTTMTIPSSDGGSNTITVSDGKIAVTQATCPDHFCMKRGFCSSGSPIVCLPNRLVISFSQSAGVDAQIG